MIKAFRGIAIAEGISYIMFALTMPLKYIFEIPQPNYIVGMAHGVLFILYCILTLLVAKQLKWDIKTTLIVGFASLIPFATFWVERKYLRETTSVG